MMKPNRAVAEHRHSALDSLDFFPTPPVATRAMVEDVLWKFFPNIRKFVVWDPCSGEGHMSEVLLEYCGEVWCSDIHDYGKGAAIGSFLKRPGLADDAVTWPAAKPRPDLICMNPPFNLATEFVLRALDEAKRGVCIIIRSTWLEGEERYNTLFRRRRPTLIAQFVDRVAMVKDRWDPKARTATAYSVIFWHQNRLKRQPTTFDWIPAGVHKRHTRVTDFQKFAVDPRKSFDERAATLFAAE